MKITALDSVTLRVLRDSLQKAVEPVAKDHGISIHLGHFVYNSENATIRLEVATVGRNGQAKTQTVTDFEKYASLFGLKISDMGRKINYAGQQYEITGLKIKSRRFPLLAKRLPDGAVFKLPVSAAKG